MNAYRLALIAVVILFCTSIVGAKTIVRPAALAGDSTRSYSHLLWQKQPGAGVPIQLLSTNNSSDADWYSVEPSKQATIQTETRTVPTLIHSALEELIKNAQFLDPTSANSRYQLQVTINEFETLYALTGSDNVFNRGFAELDRVWSALNGDNKNATVKLTMVLFDRDQPVLEVPLIATLDPCDRTSEPMIFGPSRYQTFLNRFAQTTSGQAFIAAINRGLEEINAYLADHPIATTIVDVEQHSIILNTGKNLLSKGIKGQLVYTNSSEKKPRHQGEIQVIEVYDDYSVAYPIGIHIANVLVGDRVELDHPIGKRQFKSVGRRTFNCKQPSFESIILKQTE